MNTEKNAKDLVNSLGLYISKETGILKGDYTNKDIGILGASQTDILDIAEKYKKEEIVREEARAEFYASSQRFLIASMVAASYDFLVGGLVNFVSSRLPLLRPIVRTAAVMLKKPIVEKVTYFVEGVVQKAGNFLKKLFSW